MVGIAEKRRHVYSIVPDHSFLEANGPADRCIWFPEYTLLIEMSVQQDPAGAEAGNPPKRIKSGTHETVGCILQLLRNQHETSTPVWKQESHIEQSL